MSKIKTLLTFLLFIEASQAMESLPIEETIEQRAVKAFRLPEGLRGDALRTQVAFVYAGCVGRSEEEVQIKKELNEYFLRQDLAK